MALSIIRQVMYALSVRISNINTPGQITFKGELLLFLAVLQVLTDLDTCEFTMSIRARTIPSSDECYLKDPRAALEADDAEPQLSSSMRGIILHIYSPSVCRPSKPLLPSHHHPGSTAHSCNLHMH
jgi:hypothetical protein